MVDIVIKEDLINHVSEYDAIIIGTNCYQVMRNGFQNEVVQKYKYVLERNYETKYGDINKLGTILECKNEGDPIFILAFTTFGYNFKGNDNDFFDYSALEKCIKLVNILYKGKRIATTMIGCMDFDGNADKEKILDIINTEAKDIDLTIYDYKQIPHSKFVLNEYKKNLKKRYAKNKEKIKLGRKNTKKT